MKTIHIILSHIPIIGIFSMFFGGSGYIFPNMVYFYTSAISQVILPTIIIIKFLIG